MLRSIFGTGRWVAGNVALAALLIISIFICVALLAGRGDVLLPLLGVYAFVAGFLLGREG
ncbi:hypothetical protein FHS82_001065 [Pseudochelatococcus lubricantis]|uniref:Uncharacterized protein n=1 Tax=Pseudochelatococcus lubricantis TaxID=1538102 RepID=A0ABX0UY77_9HYPH|nr:hypothetical protein [Pseudochelatococcus lubricantis]NIJ57239.1 hypothetical protein [Pseudochelatococcus lubricantis]